MSVNFIQTLAASMLVGQQLPLGRIVSLHSPTLCRLLAEEDDAFAGKSTETARKHLHAMIGVQAETTQGKYVFCAARKARVTNFYLVPYDKLSAFVEDYPNAMYMSQNAEGTLTPTWGPITAPGMYAVWTPDRGKQVDLQSPMCLLYRVTKGQVPTDPMLHLYVAALYDITPPVNALRLATHKDMGSRASVDGRVGVLSEVTYRLEDKGLLYVVTFPDGTTTKTSSAMVNVIPFKVVNGLDEMTAPQDTAPTITNDPGASANDSMEDTQELAGSVHNDEFEFIHDLG
jgi:hypothetical protein